jgi:hypothetical protein
VDHAVGLAEGAEQRQQRQHDYAPALDALAGALLHGNGGGGGGGVDHAMGFAECAEAQPDPDTAMEADNDNDGLSGWLH